MPDALSKTIPIWIAVINRLLFPDTPEEHCLRTSTEIVGPSEHSQIEAKLDGLVGDVQVYSQTVKVERTQ